MVMEKVESEPQAKLLSVYQAARRLGVTESALRSWVFRKRIASKRIGARVVIPETEIARLAARE
jgi:excisionase family DNA binding protein